MRLSDIVKHLSRIFERKRKNPILLEKDSNLESNLKNVKIGNESTIVDISETELKIRGTINADAINVDGSSVQTGTDAGATELNELSDVTYSSGDLTITSLDKIVADDFVVDSGASVELDAHNGNFVAKKAGTEFSVANSAYAGMIVGYTCIRNLSADSGDETITIGTSMTVLETAQSTKVSVTFKAPPSGNVEIEFSTLCDASSKTIRFALSDNATFNELAAIHTYDNKCITIDETDDVVANIRWFLTGLTAGSSYQYWVAAKASSSSAYIYHGSNRFAAYSPPITVKAIALPATITSGE